MQKNDRLSGNLKKLNSTIKTSAKKNQKLIRNSEIKNYLENAKNKFQNNN